MRIYTDASSDTVNIIQSVASASTMVSSVAHEAKQYILSKFPKNFFRHIYIDTSNTVVQQNYNDKYNKNANKIPYPSMGITPEISLDDPIGAMQKGLHLSSPNLYLRRDVNRTYKKLVLDADDQFGIYYTSDYITTNFNFKIITNSFIQNTDTAFFLQSRFQRGFFQFVNSCPILTEVPKTFIRLISDIKGWNLDRPTDIDSLRLFLIGTSKQPECIQRRVNLSTGKNCFFLNELENLLVLFDDLDCPASINRENQVEGEYIITFRLQVSCWLPSAFIFSLKKKTIKQLEEETVNLIDAGEPLESGFYSTTVLTNQEILNRKETIYFEDNLGGEQIGQLIYHENFTYNLQNAFPTIELMERLNENIQKVSAYGYSNLQLNLSQLFSIKVFNYNGEISKDEFEIDYETLTVHFTSQQETDIAVAVYMNRLLYESINKAMNDDVNYFNKNILTKMLLKIRGINKKAFVKSFTSKTQYRNSDPSKALRIKTPYGIGYISLVANNKTDGYRICVGYDKNNKPIIRKIELDETENLD